MKYLEIGITLPSSRNKSTIGKYVFAKAEYLHYTKNKDDCFLDGKEWDDQFEEQ